jgi:mRNA interferase RelE/StbE
MKWSAALSWKIEFLPQAEKDLKAIDKPERSRIFSFLRERVSGPDDPRSIGEALRGKELG